MAMVLHKLETTSINLEKAIVLPKDFAMKAVN